MGSKTLSVVFPVPTPIAVVATVSVVVISSVVAAIAGTIVTVATVPVVVIGSVMAAIAGAVVAVAITIAIGLRRAISGARWSALLPLHSRYFCRCERGVNANLASQMFDGQICYIFHRIGLR